MEMRAVTQATWDGAPPPLFCAPRSKMPQSPKVAVVVGERRAYDDGGRGVVRKRTHGEGIGSD